MEDAVLRDERRDVVAADERGEPLAAGAEHVELFGGDAGGRPSRGVALEHSAELVHLLERGDVVRPNRRAAVGRALEQPLGLEDEQRLPDRRAADPELLRELLLLEPLAGGDAALDDCLTDQVGSRDAGRPGKRRLALEDRDHGRRPYSMQSGL